MSTIKQSFSTPASSAGWKAVFSLYLFFAYFLVLPQLILYVTDNTVFVGLRQAIVTSVLWFVSAFLAHTLVVWLLSGLVLAGLLVYPLLVGDPNDPKSLKVLPKAE